MKEIKKFSSRCFYCKTPTNYGSGCPCCNDVKKLINDINKTHG